jgi:hypothetical protein
VIYIDRKSGHRVEAYVMNPYQDKAEAVQVMNLTGFEPLGDWDNDPTTDGFCNQACARGPEREGIGRVFIFPGDYVYRATHPGTGIGVGDWHAGSPKGFHIMFEERK